MKSILVAKQIINHLGDEVLEDFGTDILMRKTPTEYINNDLFLNSIGIHNNDRLKALMISDFASSGAYTNEIIELACKCVDNDLEFENDLSMESMNNYSKMTISFGVQMIKEDSLSVFYLKNLKLSNHLSIWMNEVDITSALFDFNTILNIENLPIFLRHIILSNRHFYERDIFNKFVVDLYKSSSDEYRGVRIMSYDEESGKYGY